MKAWAVARRAGRSTRRRRQLGQTGVVLAGILLGLAFVAAQGLQAWTGWARERGVIVPSSLPPGTLCSVMLVNGQIYYGDLVEANPRFVSLASVYYVQVDPPAAAGAAPNNRLVSRGKVDWHAPTLMAIPADKVLMLEAVGEGSRLAALIRQDRGAPIKP